MSEYFKNLTEKNERIKKVLIAAGFNNVSSKSLYDAQLLSIGGTSPIGAKQDNYMRTFHRTLKQSIDTHGEKAVDIVISNIMKSSVDIQKDFFSMVDKCEPSVKDTFSNAKSRYLTQNRNN